MSKTVALVTHAGMPHLDEDDRPLVAALEREGLEAAVAVWSDPEVDWSRFACVLVRSTWDYHRRLDEFLAWTRRAGRLVVNAPEVLAWNAHKRYLLDLAARGVPVVPTTVLARGSAAPRLDADVFVKLAVSAGAEGVARGDETAKLEDLLARGDVLVQPLVPSLVETGERSILAFADEVSHAVDRRPGVHGPDRGRPAAATDGELAVARAAIAAAHDAIGDGAAFPYARVDLVRMPGGEAVVVELELIEPSLFLRHEPGAPSRLARAVRARVDAAR